jgi:hypothetical protein
MYYDDADKTKRCNGPDIQVVLQVNPTPKGPKSLPANTLLDFCNNETVSAFTFASDTKNTIFRWTATGNDIGFGLPTDATGNLPGFVAKNNTTPQQTGVGATNIIVTSISNMGCPSIDDNLKFTLKVKPVPQMKPYDPIEVCAGTEHVSKRFVLDPRIVAAYPSADSTFSWSITGNIPESGLSDNSPATPPGYGYLPSFTPSIALAPGQTE